MPNAEVSSSQDILAFLRSKDLISDHKSHSAKETQTLEGFIDTDIHLLMNELRRPLKAKFQYYSAPRHFKQSDIKREWGPVARSYFWNLCKLFHLHFKEKRTIYADIPRKKRQDLIDEIHEAFDEWIRRLDGEKYHGGNELGPDAADFRMYAEMTRVHTLPDMQGIMKTRTHQCKFV